MLCTLLTTARHIDASLLFIHSGITARPTMMNGNISFHAAWM